MRVLYLADLLNLLTSLAASSFCFDAFVWRPMYNTVYILPMKLSQSCLQRSGHHLHYLVVSLPRTAVLSQNTSVQTHSLLYGHADITCCHIRQFNGFVKLLSFHESSGVTV